MVEENKPVWSHRPTVEEHEAAVKAQQEAGYASMSAFIREAVLRLTYADDQRPLFTGLQDSMQKLEEVLKIGMALYIENRKG